MKWTWKKFVWHLYWHCSPECTAESWDLQVFFSAWTKRLGPAGGYKRPLLWTSTAPSWGSQRALILLCQPLSTPAHYTTSWETSGVYFGIKMGQYLCGMWNNNNALWEYYTGPEKGGGLFIRNKSFAVLPASDENLFLLGFVEKEGWSVGTVEALVEKGCSKLLTVKPYIIVCVPYVSHFFRFLSW